MDSINSFYESIINTFTYLLYLQKINTQSLVMMIFYLCFLSNNHTALFIEEDEGTRLLGVNKVHALVDLVFWS